MIKTNVTRKFKFWCQTDAPSGIDSEISIIPIDVVDPTRTRYHKLSLLEYEQLSGDCVSFDLDMIIINNIDHYLQPVDKFTLLYASFKSVDDVARKNRTRTEFKDCMINSSIFSWVAHSDNVKEILARHYTAKSDPHRGSLDRFLYWDCPDLIRTFAYRDYCLYKKDGFLEDKTFILFNQYPKQRDVLSDPKVSRHWSVSPPSL